MKNIIDIDDKTMKILKDRILSVEEGRTKVIMVGNNEQVKLPELKK